MKPFVLWGVSVSPLIVLPAAYLVIVIVGWFLKRVIFTWLSRISARTATEIDDVVIRAASPPVSLMIFVWGLTATLHIAGDHIPAKFASSATVGAKLATLAAAIMFADRLMAGVFRHSARRLPALRFAESFGTVAIHTAVFCIGGLMLLDSIGVSITPIVASLGIGSLAVALALQPTLENFFSGFQILMDQPLRPGDFVKLESGEEGFVEKVGWRTTWIRQLPNNMIIIPNKQLVASRLTNFYYPSLEQAVLVQVGVHYTSDLDKVERVTTEVAAEILKRVPGGVADFQPFIRYHTFNSSSIDFSVILRAKEFVDNYLIKHEFIKALAARYAKENIVIPFPITAVNTAQEAAVFRQN